MKSKQVYLAVDLGAESGRVVAGEFDGETLQLVPLNTFANGAVELGGRTHWNIVGLYQGIIEGLSKASSIYGDSIVSVGVDSWGVDYGLLDEEGELLGVPFHYRDSRTDGKIESFHTLISDTDLYSKTGIQSLFFNTLYQLYAQAQSGSKALKEAKHLLFIPDLINYWLCGVKANEATIASTAQLLNQTTRSWDKDVLKAIGVSEDVFEKIVEPGVVLGPLTKSVSKIVKNDSMKVVTIGGHDTASAVAGVPAGEDSKYAFLSSGTWSLIGVEMKEPSLTEESRVNGFTNEFGVDNTIRHLKNISGLWLVQECKRQWESEGEFLDYGQITQLASDAKPFIASIDVDDPIFSTIGNMPTKIQNYCKEHGQNVPETKGEIVRVALEGLALKYREVLENLEKIAGYSIDTIHIVGGGTQNKLLNQMAADATGKQVIAGPVEATSVGNVVMQMIASGEVSGLKEGRALVARSFQPEVYHSGKKDEWEKAYQDFTKLKEGVLV